MSRTKLFYTLSAILLAINTSEISAQLQVYRSGGGEIILSGADIRMIPSGAGPASAVDVNNNMRFTLFYHLQQFVNIDLGKRIGFYTGAALRNVGLIQEDLYQYMGFTGVDNTHPNWNKTTKIKRRSYSLGFPVALKLGMIDKHYFIYAGGEYEWMFHYKQKQFIDGNKTKYTEWGSERVNPWIPSVFAGVQFPGGVNLKVKFYLDDFLNHHFTGTDFSQSVDYSQFESTRIWYISMAMILNKKQIEKMLDTQEFYKTASR
jgi:hypothetical protein